MRNSRVVPLNKRFRSHPNPPRRGGWELDSGPGAGMTVIPRSIPDGRRKIYWQQFGEGAVLFKLTVAHLLGAVTLLAAPGCADTTAQQPSDTDLVVFAASSLTDAFLEAAARFEAVNPGVKVVLNFAGSQRLRTQLEHGARADVFASADRHQLDAVVEAELAQGEPAIFAANRLALITSVHSSDSFTLADLAQPGMKLVVAQPAVPAGAYAREVLENLETKGGFGIGFATRALANVVSEEPNVRSMAQKVALGDADAGLVYWSDAQSRDIAPRVKVIPIPEDCNVAVEYLVVGLRTTREPGLARRFMDYLLSHDGQRILERHGFGAGVGVAEAPVVIPGKP